MILIGSRAIRTHIPEFRKPIDWDLIGTRAEAERLAQVLEPDPRAKRLHHKAQFLLDGAKVEMILSDCSPHWQQLTEILRNDPVMKHPKLGDLIIPPASFLMLTKHCALGYPIAHWHKNMAEVYFMRNYIPEIPERIAATVPILQDSCRVMYADPYAKASVRPTSCHPKATHHSDQALHRRLHEHLALGEAPLVDQADAWKAFPELPKESRSEKMRQVLAEEAMVLGGHYYVETDIRTRPKPSSEVKRYAIRALLTGGLPQAWRYFGVNHYREIAALIPEDFLNNMSVFDELRPLSTNECTPATDAAFIDETRSSKRDQI